MTDRDEFAKAALIGFTSSLRPGAVYDLDLVAKQVYELADAVLRAREVSPVSLCSEKRAFSENPAVLPAQKDWPPHIKPRDPASTPQVPRKCSGVAAAVADVYAFAAKQAAATTNSAEISSKSVDGHWAFLNDEIARLRLTDAEREAVELAYSRLTADPYWSALTATLRGLLERTK